MRLLLLLPQVRLQDLSDQQKEQKLGLLYKNSGSVLRFHLERIHWVNPNTTELIITPLQGVNMRFLRLINTCGLPMMRAL